MAKKKESKIVLERTYNVPLRREFIKVPKYKKAAKAVRGLRAFLIRHMKPGTDEKGKIMLKIGKYLNEAVWARGMRNPPHHVQVDAKKDEKGMVTAELTGAPKEEVKEEKKKKAEKKETEEEAEKKEKQKEALKELKKEKPKTPAPKMPAAEKKIIQRPTAPMSQ